METPLHRLEAETIPSRKGALLQPFPDLWRRCKRTYELQNPQRTVEVDTIVASKQDWESCLERLEGGWDLTEVDGVIYADKIFG